MFTDGKVQYTVDQAAEQTNQDGIRQRRGGSVHGKTISGASKSGRGQAEVKSRELTRIGQNQES